MEPESAQSLNGEQIAARIQEDAVRLQNEISKVILGQSKVIEETLLGLFCGEHLILTGVPGLAKTLLIRTIADCLHLDFKRIQFTPDLMPTDITGLDILQEDPATRSRKLEFLPGPVFTNLLLADEINRTPPKTQSAMLQVMQERQVSIGSVTHDLPKPFHVFATQNPIEMEGTYILPEAAADRFMLAVHCHYPALEDEVRVALETTGNQTRKAQPVLDGNELLEIHQWVRAMPVSKQVVQYAVRLVSSTRPETKMATEAVKAYVRWGAGPRASQYLILGAKGRAAMQGKPCADYDDVRSVAFAILNHRVLLNFKAKAQKIEFAEILESCLKQTPES